LDSKQAQKQVALAEALPIVKATEFHVPSGTKNLGASATTWQRVEKMSCQQRTFFLSRADHDEMCQINNAPGLTVILTAMRCRLLFV